MGDLKIKICSIYAGSEFSDEISYFFVNEISRPFWSFVVPMHDQGSEFKLITSIE
jgi:hypothetical protein